MPCMTQNANAFLKLFGEMSRCVERFGIEKTAQILKDLYREKQAEIDVKKEARKIKLVICKEFGVTEDDLHNGRGFHERTLALYGCFYYYKNFLRMEPKEIARYFDKSASLVYKGI